MTLLLLVVNAPKGYFAERNWCILESLLRVISVSRVISNLLLLLTVVRFVLYVHRDFPFFLASMSAVLPTSIFAVSSSVSLDAPSVFLKVNTLLPYFRRTLPAIL